MRNNSKRIRNRNGPCDTEKADIGIAGGDGEGLIFKKGEIIRKVPEAMLLDELKRELDILTSNM